MFSIDFETYGTRDIREVGMDNYMADPFFRPLVVGVATPYNRTWYDLLVPQEEQSFIDFMTQHQHDWMSAHNAGFDVNTLVRYYSVSPPARVVDSAVISRQLGAGSALAHAAPALLGAPKDPEGEKLIQEFCVGKPGQPAPKHEDVAGNPRWELLGKYAASDAGQSYDISAMDPNRFELRIPTDLDITMQMNEAGWPVDRDLMDSMIEQMERNLDTELAVFHIMVQEELPDTFFNSPKQMKAWCEERGLKMSSFDKQHVAQGLRRVKRNLAKRTTRELQELHAMLATKQALGGSSIKKLNLLRRLIGEDGRLRNQYLHCGAGTTHRTSSIGLQMQNLHRLTESMLDAEAFMDGSLDPDNNELADNIRQVFRAPGDGQLIVGDFSSVESRGLAYIAGEEWKLDAFRKGKDMYKVMAEKMYHIPYDNVDKPTRQKGKTGELGCGYNAGPGALVSFADKMGQDLKYEEALEIVTAWRESNPMIVKMWHDLDNLLHTAIRGQLHGMHSLKLAHEITIHIIKAPTYKSVTEVHPGAVNLTVLFSHPQMTFVRTIVGAYVRGRNIVYHKPSKTKSGPLWKDTYTVNKIEKKNTIYGGKLTGWLTQSMCREMFFESMRIFSKGLETNNSTNAKIIGQFHDEIVVEWQPPDGEHEGDMTLEETQELLTAAMQYTPLPEFPLAAAVFYDKRYTK